MSLITCNKCFFNYCNDLQTDIDCHNKLHNKYINLAMSSSSFDDNYVNFYDEDSKSMYLENIKILDDINEQIFYFKKLSQMYYSRSIFCSEFDKKHPTFESYVAMLLNNNILNLKNEYPKLYECLTKEFGTLKGLKNDSTIFEVN